jgi:hypothetical protein
MGWLKKHRNKILAAHMLFTLSTLAKPAHAKISRHTENDYYELGVQANEIREGDDSEQTTNEFIKKLSDTFKSLIADTQASINANKFDSAIAEIDILTHSMHFLSKKLLRENPQFAAEKQTLIKLAKQVAQILADRHEKNIDLGLFNEAKMDESLLIKLARSLRFIDQKKVLESYVTKVMNTKPDERYHKLYPAGTSVFQPKNGRFKIVIHFEWHRKKLSWNTQIEGNILRIKSKEWEEAKLGNLPSVADFVWAHTIKPKQSNHSSSKSHGKLTLN